MHAKPADQVDFKATPSEQLQILKKGVAELISDAELLKKLEKSYQTKKPLLIKFGADPTRPDIHLGHTVVINKLKAFQDLGHHIHFLIGDFTALIGDPSGRNSSRPIMTEEDVRENGKTYAQQIFKILNPEKTEIVYNSSWLKNLNSIDFVKLAAKMTVARMIERDDFSKRYKEGSPIYIHEFLYPLTQGYDSVALKSDVELGGTDQKFNLLVGRDLQGAWGQDAQCVLTMPILEGLDGVNKMSKSLDNYISVVDSPKDMFGKTLRTSDELMYRFYELLTDLTVGEITELKNDVASGKRHPKDVKVNLAKMLITRFHSKQDADNAEAEFQRIFVDKGLPDQIDEFKISGQEIGISQLIVMFHGAQSNSDAARLIQGGGVSIDNVKQSDPRQKLNLTSGQNLLFKVGKKKFVKVIVG
ncbi:MAG: tyrosine--tRNA ligase [Pseudobdellovibrionaceae bacterium]